MNTTQPCTLCGAQKFIDDEIERLTRYFTDLWFKSGSDFPEFDREYLRADHRLNDGALQDTIRQISEEMETQARNPQRQGQGREKMLSLAAALARRALHFEDRHVDLILDNGFFDVAGEFARQVRAFDSSISDDDIYQAARNVMTMNFIQLLLDIPVSLTPSIFAYSLLYPLTDNYLDGDGLSRSDKQAFCQRFGRRLHSESIEPGNPKEAQVWRCVEMMEQEFPRGKFPLVHASLVGIHDAQVESLGLLRKNAAPYDVDILRLTFAKGGAAVLADGYLVAGDLDMEQRLFMFAYGVFTQLIDDLEDTQKDKREGVMTLFSQSSGKWKLDTLTNRLFRFGGQAFQTVNVFKGPQTQTLKEMIWKCIDPLLIDMASQTPADFSKEYLYELEKHFPFSYRGLAKQRRRLENHHFQLMGLVRAFAKEI